MLLEKTPPLHIYTVASASIQNFHTFTFFPTAQVHSLLLIFINFYWKCLDIFSSFNSINCN